MKETLHAPTPEQLAAGPVVTLIRPGWEMNTWSPHGFNYSIRFAGGRAEILEDHFNEWIGDELAAVYGITVKRPDKPKVQSQPAAAPKVSGCPTCGATGDEPCRTGTGKRASAPHKDRS